VLTTDIISRTIDGAVSDDWFRLLPRGILILRSATYSSKALASSILAL
jgi:hypothetical protein